MNFDPMGYNEYGQPYMKRSRLIGWLERIQMLQRWILVQTYAFHYLGEIVATEFQYDYNSRQLIELMEKHPIEARRSLYHDYFDDYAEVYRTGESGFILARRIRDKDPDLHRSIMRNASSALISKQKYSKED